jgi:regulator of protease activity HflC (stomatin/prohibitin superfamily)
MLWLIVTVVLLLVVVGLILAPPVTSGYGSAQKRYSLRPYALIALGLTLLWTLLMCFTAVPAKDDGVLVSFGSVSNRTLDSGIHFKAPWTKVVDIDGTIQTDRYHGNKDTDTSSACIKVLIGDGSTTCMSVTNRWRVDPGHTNEVYKNYRSNNPTDHLRDAVGSTQLLAAAQDVAGTYNPVNTLKTVDPADPTSVNINFKPDLKAMSEALTANMRERTNGLVQIVDVTISFLPTPATTQDRINAFVREVANTRVKAQEKLTKQNEAAANDALSASLKNDPNLLISKCLDMVADGKANLPANFQCFPGGGATAVFPVTK